jgi:hypothetical protein
VEVIVELVPLVMEFSIVTLQVTSHPAVVSGKD